MVIWQNGEFVTWEKATVHVLTHALHYGSAIFEGIRAYRTKNGGTSIFRLDAHLQRLFNSAKIHMLDVPWTAGELSTACQDLLRLNKLNEAYLRPIIYIAAAETPTQGKKTNRLSVDPTGLPIHAAIGAWKWEDYLGTSHKEPHHMVGTDKGVKTIVSSWQRIDSNTLPPAAKTAGNYVNSVFAQREARLANAHEAILLNKAGMVTDGSGENIFVVKNGKLLTPPLSAGCLEGVTRDSLLTLARDLSIPTAEPDLPRTDLYTADEAFFSGTAVEMAPIASVDGRTLHAPGPIFEKLRKTLNTVIRGETTDYAEWRYPV